jgi:hypothetical protein
VLALIGLTVLAGVLRYATLNTQSIWLDESATIILVRHGLWGTLSHLSASESAPPLYYVLAWAWTEVFGDGPLGFRSLSALIGTATVPVMYLAGRRVSPRVGLWAAALTVVSPVMYYYSQEARAYGLLVLLSAASFVLWQRALEQPSRRNLALWSGMSCLALLTHYFAAFLIVPEIVMLSRRIGWKRLGAPVAAIALIACALLPLAIAERTDNRTTWIEAESLPGRVAESVKNFVVGPYAPLEIPAALLLLLLAGAALLVLWRRADRAEQQIARNSAVVAVSAFALPLFLAVAHLIDVFDGRNVIATWVPLAVVVAAGLGAQRAGRAGPLIGVGVCAISLAVIVALNALPAYQRDDWRGVADTLPKSAHGRVIVAGEYSSLPLYVYLGPLQSTHGASVRTTELDFATLRVKRSARSPLAPVAPTEAPAGFRLVQVRRTSSFAVSRFVAPTPTTVSTRVLRRLLGEAQAEVILER